MNVYRTKRPHHPRPTILYGLACLMSLWLHRVLPMPVAYGEGWETVASGSAVIGLAVVLELWALRTLIDMHDSAHPARGIPHLITCGPFRFTRNPIYLGHTLAMVGLGIATGNAWLFLSAIVLIVVTTIYAIRREEQHMLSRFGFEFERYCRMTSRWI